MVLGCSTQWFGDSSDYSARAVVQRSAVVVRGHSAVVGVTKRIWISVSNVGESGNIQCSDIKWWGVHSQIPYIVAPNNHYDETSQPPRVGKRRGKSLVN